MKASQILSLVALSIFLSACGAQSYRDSSITQAVTSPGTGSSALSVSPTSTSVALSGTAQFYPSGGTSPYYYSIVSGSGSVSTSGLYTAPSSAGSASLRVMDSAGASAYASITISSSGGGTGGVPNYNYSFDIVGNIASQAGSSYTVSSITTDNILKVKVTSGPSGGIGGGASGNFNTAYGCVTYRVTVLGQATQTVQLSVPGISNSNCPTAPTSQILDFSGRLTTGHGAVDIKVDNVMTDARFWSCVQTWGAYWSYYCQSFYPMTLNYDARMNGYTGAWIATGSLEIAVNGTAGF